MNEPARAQAIEKEAIAQLLQSNGIAVTAQRVEIAALLLSRQQHLAADQVLAKVNESTTTVSKATVYNTLGLFADRGLIRQVIVDPTKVFYDSNTRAHHHLYNVDDCTLTDIDELPVDILPKLPQGTCIDAVDIVIRIKNCR